MARSTSRPAKSRATTEEGPPPLVLRGLPSTAVSPAAGDVDLRALLRSYLTSIDAESGRTFADRLIESWVGLAIAGNFKALQEILERTQLMDAPPVAPAGYDDRAALWELEQSVEHDLDIPID